jgi:tetratricopeptide (TPR) repeat protein
VNAIASFAIDPKGTTTTEATRTVETGPTARDQIVIPAAPSGLVSAILLKRIPGDAKIVLCFTGKTVDSLSSRRRSTQFGALSRRDFLRWCGAPILSGVPTLLRPDTVQATPEHGPPGTCPAAWADFRLTPHYRAQSDLGNVLSQTRPGRDPFVSELYAEEVAEILARWSAALCRIPPSLTPIVDVLSPDLAATPLRPKEETPLRNWAGLQLWRGQFPSELNLRCEAFVQELSVAFPTAWQLRTAHFEVAGITVGQESPLTFSTRIRYDLVGSSPNGVVAERLGLWDLEWIRTGGGTLNIRTWRSGEQTRSSAAGRVFEDTTAWSLGENASYAQQMLRGTEYWRSVLDGACGIDVYGNNGVACGDIDNDGFDEIYVCQPAGLPNRLYRNRGDGKFDDITERSRLDVLDDTSSAIFADITNRGLQDLIVIRSNGPLLFRNMGDGIFQIQPDAFHFAKPPQGTFTGAALGDYDRDGWLDIYCCLYSYYEGIDQYRYPTPYFDAENGPPNFLLRNNRDGTFSDVTAAAGLNQNNHRFSFDCGWCDYNQDGWPDLYVVNDFGRKNLYRNNGNGTFTDVAEELGVVDVGPGMSSYWFDFDNDGNQDLYVCDMWEPAGTRVGMQQAFMPGVPEDVRALYRRHAKGNSLFRNQGDGSFTDHSAAAGVEKVGWSWSCGAWDFDHDGRSDLYIANGMISGPNQYDLQGFFWRQVVSQSPIGDTPSRPYEEGWNAINELIRSDGTWNGYQRNVFFVNNGDGSFSHVAGTVGLDFADDSRAFSLADLDHDGSLEVVLKNRTGPQLRILRNVMPGRGDSICFRLRGHTSNRDAIGAVVTLESPVGRQVKFLQAGTGFFSQHSKELFFGLGQHRETVQATIHWPNGKIQKFDALPANHRIYVQEGFAEFKAEPFVKPSRIPPEALREQKPDEPPACCETWLLDPLPAPEFTLRDLQDRPYTLSDFRGRYVLLNFWDSRTPSWQTELDEFHQQNASWLGQGLQLLCVCANGPNEIGTAREFAKARGLKFPILIGSDEMLARFNLLYRYLFDRRRNLGLPTTLLIDRRGMIVKVYQGPLNAASPRKDLPVIPKNQKERESRALPFPGTLYAGEFHRNLFTYGVAFFRAGYLDEALVWFQQVVQRLPEYAAAYYNLGTIYLRKGLLPQAQENLRRATQLRPGDASAWNNLGMAAAQEGQREEAIECFQEAIRHNPRHVVALENLGKVYNDSGQAKEAEKAFERALSIEPLNPDLNYDLGMFFAKSNKTDEARAYLQKAIQLRPDYPDALNNLGVLEIRSSRLNDAESILEKCVRVAPDFDVAYLNLARVYLGLRKPEKARDILHQLLKIHPQNQAAQRTLEEIGP